MRKVSIRLSEILKEKGMTQKELAKLTGLRANVISELVNNQRTTFNKEHLMKICDTLEIDDISELIEIVKH